jgi:hypothetical protein
LAASRERGSSSYVRDIYTAVKACHGQQAAKATDDRSEDAAQARFWLVV